jgi:hypothetical protein
MGGSDYPFVLVWESLRQVARGRANDHGINKHTTG